MSYFSSIRNLFNPADLPTHLGAVSYLINDLPLDDLLGQVFYRNLRHYTNAYGDKITYTLDLVLLEGLGLDMPLPGFRLDLNGDPSLDNAMVIPLSLTYQLPILRYVDRFEPDMENFGPADYYEFLLTSTQVTPDELLLAVLEVMIDDQNPVQAFIDYYEATNPALSIVIDPAPEVTIQNLVAALESAAVDLFQYVFDAYLAAPDPSQTIRHLSWLFYRWVDFDEAALKKLTRPFIQAAINEIGLSLSFPRSILRPIKTEAHQNDPLASNTSLGDPLPKPFQTRLSFDLGGLHFNSETGFEIESIDDFNFDYSEIGNTGIRLGISDLLLDFSGETTPAQLRDLGFDTRFVGIYARHAQITWSLPQLQIGNLSKLHIDTRDVAIGNQGLSIAIDYGWELDEADPFGSGSEMAGQILNGWGVALHTASGRFIYRHLVDENDNGSDSWEIALAVAGLIHIPFWNENFSVRFALQAHQDGYMVQLGLALATPPLTIELGDGNQLTFDAFAAQGVFETNGHFDLSGTTRGAIEVRAGNLNLLQGAFDIPTLRFAVTDTSTLTFQGVFNALLFGGSPFEAQLQNLNTTLFLAADDDGITDFRLDLADFTTHLNLGNLISLHIADCLLDLNPNGSPQAILDYGFDAEFLGLLSRQTKLAWEIPGISFDSSLELGKVIIGNEGVGIQQTWSKDIQSARLFGSWAIGLTLIDGLLVFDDAKTSHLTLAGTMEVPFFDTTLKAGFSLKKTPFGYQVRLSLIALNSQIDLGGGGTLSIDDLEMEGTIDENGFALFGQIGSGVLKLTDFGDPFTLNNTLVSFSCNGARYAFEIDVDGLGIPLGDADALSLGSKLLLRGGDNGLDEILIEGEAIWEDLDFAPLPEFLPLPPEDATVSALLHWEADTWQIRFSAEVEEVESLWRFLPDSYIPDTKDGKFVFDGQYDTIKELFVGEVKIACVVQLPQLPDYPGMELIHLYAGDDEGWIGIEIVSGMEQVGPTADLQPYMKGKLTELAIFEFDLPGIPQARPPLYVEIDAVDFDLKTDKDGDVTGGFKLLGNVELRPLNPAESTLPIPPAMAIYLDSLFKPFKQFQIIGAAEIGLQFTADDIQFDLVCQFADSTIELDLFDMFAGALKGTSPTDELASTENSIDLDIDIQFDLNKIALQLGSVAPTANASEVALMLDVGLTVAGVPGEIVLELSDQQFALGLKTLTLPLDIPQFPFKLSDMDALQGADGLWDYEDKWINGVEPALKADVSNTTDQVKKTKARIAQLEAILNAMNGDDNASSEVMAELSKLKYDILPGLNKEAFLKAGRLFMIDAIFVVYNTLTQNHLQFQTIFAAYQTIIDNSIGMIYLDTGLALNLFDVRIVLPFNDPSNIALEGGAKLKGFNADSFLAPLNEVGFKLGISAEYVYFYVDTGEDGLHIAFPDVGYYSGAEIALEHFQLGYGFTKNALNVVIAGGVTLPERLVEDIDTSDLIGAGLRLPVDSYLLFHLDLIPIVLGEVDFLLPLIEFDLDLRRDDRSLPAGPDCEPAWDGLQLHVPGIIRTSFKRTRFSPFFGPLPAPNYTQSYDIVLGSNDVGLTLVCDNYLVITPVAGNYPIPLFADYVPFFDNYCLVVRLGGFAIKMHLQRPFPSLAPMAMFELLGLMADPNMPIDPVGSLAQTIRFTVTDSFVDIPAAVLRMFPELGNKVRRNLTFTINLGSAIIFFQQTKAIVDSLLEQANAAAGNIQDFVSDIQDNPPDFSPHTALAMLPKELRRIETHGALGGFAATAVLLLITPEELSTAFRERQQPSPSPASPQFPINDSVDPPQISMAPLDSLSNYEPTYKSGPKPPPTHKTAGALAQLIDGDLLDAFSEGDVALLGDNQPDTSASGIIAGAYVRVFDAQKIAFLGFVYSDGHFGLMSTIDFDPLKLSVAGIPVELPLTVKGRLWLRGLMRGSESEAQLTAQIYANWNVIPGVAHIRVGNSQQPVTLHLDSRGQFSLIGSGVLTLFNGAGKLRGEVDISHTHCHVAGEFNYVTRTTINRQPLIDLSLDLQGRIGPGMQFSLSGAGTLNILGNTVTDVRSMLSERGAMIEAVIDTDNWRLFNLPISRVYMALSGFIDISQRAWPTIALAGKCHISLFGDQGIDIEGRGGFRASDKKLIMYAEGKLKWLGREWLNGRIELGTNRIYLAGRTSFTLPLLAVPDGLKEQLGTLFLSLEIGGEFEMDSQGRLRKCVLDGQWLLAVKTPNAGEQVMPIAMQALNIDYRPLRVTSRATILPLVFIDSLALFPADGITLPIPNITTEKALYLTFEPLTLSGKINAPRIVAGTSSSANYKVPYEWEASTKSINMVNYVRRAYNKLSPVDFPRPSPMPKVNMSVPKFKVKKSIGIDKWYEYSFNVTSFDLPQLSVTKPNHTAKPLIEIPTELALDWQDTSLGTILENLNFSLAFGWQDKSPGIIVQYGRERSFIKF